MTDEIEERLAAWKQEYDAIASADAGAGGAEEGGIDALTRAAQRVPELTERKRLLDMHTNICTVNPPALLWRRLGRLRFRMVRVVVPTGLVICVSLSLYLSISLSLSDSVSAGGRQTLLSHIKERELDNLFSLESAIASGTVYNAKSALLQVLPVLLLCCPLCLYACLIAVLPGLLALESSRCR